MRKLVSVISSIFVFALLFTACEKETLSTIDTPQTQTQSEKPLAQYDQDAAKVEALDVIEEGNGVETRGLGVLVYNLTTTVAANGWRSFGYSKSTLAGYRYTAVVTPIGGDPDVYAYGYDIGAASPWRYIRRSATAGADQVKLAGSDLKTDEEYGYFSVYGFTASTFNIKIYREDICDTEDCIPVRTSTVKAVPEGSRFLITDGVSRMFMAPNDAEAKKIVKVFHHYGINQSCFVGRPGASFFYLNKDGNAPVGAMQGEDCISFNPNTIEVKEIGGRWKIVDGNHWMFDFDTKEDEARKAFCIIKKYGFTKSCYVGRPGPSLEYLRK